MSGANCESCEAGMYQDGIEKDSCVDCPRGTVSTNAAASSCDICKMGEFMNTTGSSKCDTCKKGRFKKEQLFELFEGNPFDKFTCAACPKGQ